MVPLFKWQASLVQALILSIVFTVAVPSLSQEANGGAAAGGGGFIGANNPFEPGQALREYTTNLTENANRGDYQQLIQRHDEIRRLYDVLGGGRSVWLVGEAGAGKTTLVQTAANQLPGYTIRELNIAQFISQTGNGDLPGRIQGLTSDLIEAQKKGERIILFVDEFHVLREAPGFTDLMKPHLATGAIQMIGGTTHDEYRQYIESDTAYTSRGDKQVIRDLNAKELLAVLQSKKIGWMNQFGVIPTDAALREAVDLALRFYANDVPSRKAESLIRISLQTQKSERELGNKHFLEVQSKLQAARLELNSLRIDMQIPQYANDEALKNKLQTLESTVSVLESEEKELRSQVERGNEARQAQKQDAETFKKIQEAEQNLREAEQIRGRSGALSSNRREADRNIQELQKNIETLRSRLSNPNFQPGAPEPMPWITEEDIRREIATRMGMDVRLFDTDINAQAAALEENLNSKVAGQEHLVSAMVEGFKRRRTNVVPGDAERPQSQLIAGSTGTGKTLIAKSFAKALGRNLITLEMQKFSEKHSISALIGTTAGYVGFGQGGSQLTEPVRKNPYSVVLVDEFEKAHPDVRRVFMSILDEGKITDNEGRTVDFKNTILIFTTNVGAEYALIKDTISTEELRKWLEVRELDVNLADLTGEKRHLEILRAMLRRHNFGDEEINRLGLLTYANGMTLEVAKKIVEIEIEKFNEHNMRVNGVEIVVTDRAAKALAELGFDRRNGARVLRETVERLVGKKLADLVLQNKYPRNSRVRIDFKNGVLFDVLTEGAAGQLERQRKAKVQTNDGTEDQRQANAKAQAERRKKQAEAQARARQIEQARLKKQAQQRAQALKAQGGKSKFFQTGQQIQKSGAGVRGALGKPIKGGNEGAVERGSAKARKAR